MSPSASLLLVALGAVLVEATTGPASTIAFLAPPSVPSVPAGCVGSTEARRAPSSSRGAGGGVSTAGTSSIECVSGRGLDGGTSGSMREQLAFGPRRRRKEGAPACSTFASSNTPLAFLRMAAKGNKSTGNGGGGCPPSPSPRPLHFGSAFAAAAWFRGGGGASPSNAHKGKDEDDALHLRPVIAAAVEGIGISAGKSKKETRLIIDRVEDAVCCAWTSVVVPSFHVTRLGFGLSLLFYGMAFRTFAFHVIVFRIAGFNQLQKALSQLVSKYRAARKSVREAALAAETVGERVIKGDELKAARKKMKEEKKRLMSDGVFTEEETSYFMKKYRTELLQIKEEQEEFQSARSSLMSVRRSVDPRQARTSIASVYNALVTSFTASTIQTAGQLTLALHVGSLLKTHVLDLFGPIFDPIGYRLDLNTYYDKEDIPYMGKANAMDGPQNMALNVVCYSVVFAVFHVHCSVALKASMVYYGARVVTDYIVWSTEPARRKLGQMTIIHTPWSAVIHAGLAVLGYYHHRNVLHTVGVPGLHPLAVGPGLVGLVEPCVRFFVAISRVLAHIEFFSCRFIEDPVEVVKGIAGKK
eukprot:g13502.t1